MALIYAIDKSRWSNRALGPIPPQSWAFNPDVKKYDYDLAKARDLLSKVESRPDSVTISTVPIYSSIAEQIKNDWEKIGLKTDISIGVDIPADFQMLLVAQATPTDPDQYHLWHSTAAASNLTHLNNPRIDKLLEDGRKTYDLTARQKIYQDFQRFLVEEAVAAFLFYPQTHIVARR